MALLMLLSASARGPATGGSESEVSLSSAGGGGGVPPSGRPKRPDLLGSLFASGAPPSEEETVGEADDGADSEASEVEVVLLAAVTAAGCFGDAGGEAVCSSGSPLLRARESRSASA